MGNLSKIEIAGSLIFFASCPLGLKSSAIVIISSIHGLDSIQAP
jgi:hypothetical protein